MSDWRPIDTLVRDGRLVLMAQSGGDVFIAPASPVMGLSRAERLKLAKDGHWPDYKNFTTTHWMPIPLALGVRAVGLSQT